eukprot:c16669_g1_i2.p1 GENE.c16669_g1_i2~~c16669_g1_i2.p1  ORF type:complete len:133 (-),score=31.31 c16669_g1_i2:343-741(-)
MYQSLTMDAVRSKALALERQMNSEIRKLNKLYLAASSSRREVQQSDIESQEMNRSSLNELLTATEVVSGMFSQHAEFISLMEERAASTLDGHKLEQHKSTMADMQREFLAIEFLWFRAKYKRWLGGKRCLEI